MPFFIPPPIRLTKKCERCAQRYPWSAKQCVHCAHLSDTQLIELKQRIAAEAKSSRVLGLWFYVLAALLFVILLLIKV
ncbi:MAG: hypothetical protein OEZ58_00875 [Gammaproteobacteria bacterium]|nr:hypothetical protein [Gammaproteobacteria bacterium]MDH5727528.1 hypothetical protein [Gammaproteobacteria bacterium]